MPADVAARARRANDHRSIIALDLSLTHTGVAVLNFNGKLLRALAIVTDPKDGSRIERCDYIAQRIVEVVGAYHPELIIIEDYAYSRPTSVATLGELGGIVKLRLWQFTGVSECWMTITSSHMKLEFTGSGAAKGGKERVIRAAIPYFLEAGLEPSQDDNICDSIGLAVVGLKKFGHLIS